MILDDYDLFHHSPLLAQISAHYLDDEHEIVDHLGRIKPAIAKNKPQLYFQYNILIFLSSLISSILYYWKVKIRIRIRLIFQSKMPPFCF